MSSDRFELVVRNATSLYEAEQRLASAEQELTAARRMSQNLSAVLKKQQQNPEDIDLNSINTVTEKMEDLYETMDELLVETNALTERKIPKLKKEYQESYSGMMIGTLDRKESEYQAMATTHLNDAMELYQLIKQTTEHTALSFEDSFYFALESELESKKNAATSQDTREEIFEESSTRLIDLDPLIETHQSGKKDRRINEYSKKTTSYLDSLSRQLGDETTITSGAYRWAERHQANLSPLNRAKILIKMSILNDALKALHAPSDCCALLLDRKPSDDNEFFKKLDRFNAGYVRIKNASGSDQLYYFNKNTKEVKELNVADGIETLDNELSEKLLSSNKEQLVESRILSKQYFKYKDANGVASQDFNIRSRFFSAEPYALNPSILKIIRKKTQHYHQNSLTDEQRIANFKEILQEERAIKTSNPFLSKVSLATRRDSAIVSALKYISLVVGSFVVGPITAYNHFFGNERTEGTRLMESVGIKQKRNMELPSLKVGSSGLFKKELNERRGRDGIESDAQASSDQGASEPEKRRSHGL